MNAGFWAGRRVLVTGHTGFKGSWLTLLLRELGAEVTGYALEPPTEPSLFDVARVDRGITSVLGDICDGPALESAVRTADPSVVVHMAAQSLVRASYADPAETYRVNVMGTVDLLETLRRVGTRAAVLVVTSDKCYRNRETDHAYVETDELGGHDPYSNSKACAEHVAAAFRDSFFSPAQHAEHGVGLATARAGNVIGGGDWARDRILPDIVGAISDGQPARIRHAGAHRPWQHVLDCLHGYVLLAERLSEDPASHAEAWNFGPSEEHVLPVGRLADDVCRLWGDGASWERDESPQPHEAIRLMLDSAKARTRLGLPPSMPYSAGLERTVAWYRAHHAGEDMRERTLAQIRAYRATEAAS